MTNGGILGIHVIYIYISCIIYIYIYMEYGGRMMIEARIKGVNGIFSKETQFTHHRGNGILWR